jgi:hypothetical protein
MATIKVNAGVWDDVAEEDQDTIKAILVASTLMKADDTIEGDAKTAAVYPSDDAADSETAGARMMSVGESACKTACKAARDAARAACGIKYPLSGRKRRKCREAVEKAFQGCVALCGEAT